jgi:hypothetical protein
MAGRKRGRFSTCTVYVVLDHENHSTQTARKFVSSIEERNLKVLPPGEVTLSSCLAHCGYFNPLNRPFMTRMSCTLEAFTLPVSFR